MRSSSPPGAGAAALVGLFAVSGCAGLVVETVWLRWLAELFGATAPAASATLVAVFAGQALGAAWAARAVGSWRRPLRGYAALELGAAAWALAVPALLALGGAATGAIYAALSEAPALLGTARFAIAALATLPASVAMGATLPAIGAAWLSEREELGTRGTLLYGANLLGASAGALLGAFVLPPRLGVMGSYALGWAMLAAVGAAALWLGRGSAAALRGAHAPEPAAPERRPASDLSPRARRALAALSGFGALALQVLLVRALALVLDQSVYAFGAVLAVVLAALALGAGGTSLLLSRTRVRVESALAAALSLAGLGVAVFPAVLRDLTGGLDPAALPVSEGGPALPALALAAASAGVPLLAAGALLPLLFASAGTGAGDDRPPAAPLGGLLAWNTAGAIAGALAAPWLLLAHLSLWSAFLVLALVYAVAAVFVPLSDRRGRLRRDVALGFGWIIVLARASPLSIEPVPLAEGEELVWLDTSAAGVVAVVQQGPHLTLRSDAHYDLGGTADLRHQERQGHLAALLRPGARRALWIGSATGISAGALLAGPVEALTLVEIQPAVARAGALFFAHANRGVHGDPRVRVVRDDARNFVRRTDARYDLVVADLFVPWRAGTASLYTAEHFGAVRDRLAEGGAFVQWLPLYQLSPGDFASVAATFADVFPGAALFRGDFFGRFPIAALVGWKGEPPSPSAIAAAARRRAEAGEVDRWVTDPFGVFSLYVGPPAALSGTLDAAPRNTDDRPRLAFSAARTRAEHRPLLVGDAWLGLIAPATRVAGTPADPVFPTLPEPARRAVRAGARLQAAGALWIAGHAQAAAEQIAAAAPDLPPALLDPASPDPSAAELWPESVHRE